MLPLQGRAVHQHRRRGRRRGTRLDAVAYGENADDAVRPDRPGARAASEHECCGRWPTAGLTKADVRAIARELGLPCADKPAAPCLASRIPHFQEVTPEKLRQIDRPRRRCARWASPICGCATTATSPGIELPADDLVRRGDRAAARRRSVGAVRGAGFRFVAVDLAGMQSGAFTLPLVTVAAWLADHG